MSVLSAVAFLNGSDEKLATQGGTTNFPLPPPRSTSTPAPALAEKIKVPSLPQPKSKPTTAAAIQELNRIRTGGGAGVASLLSRFGQEQQAPPPNKQQQQQRPKQLQQQLKQLQESKQLQQPREPQQPKQPQEPKQLQTQLQPKSSPIPTSLRPSPASPPPTMTTNPNTAHHITIPSPRSISSPSRKPTSQVDAIIQELTNMYQETLEQCQAAEKQLKQLQTNAEAFEADSTKVRDYEIRVEYLAQKLEQVSEERDGLERELQQYRDRHGKLDTPVSFEHRLSDIFDKQSAADDEEEDEDKEANDKFMDGILDAYDNEDNKDYISEGSVSHEDQIAFLTEQLQACDLGAKMAVQQYLTELESERRRTRTLQDMVKKQEVLIATLESRCNKSQLSTSHQPVAHAGTVVSRPPRNASLASPTYTERHLRDQIESQRVELEDKREILTQLLNEREGMRMKAGKSINSIDRLAELARVSSSPALSPPPRDPLPPLPGTALTSPSKSSSGRDSLSSFRDDDGASSLTSWSASSDKNPQNNDFENMYTDYLGPEKTSYLGNEKTNEHHLLALRLLEGS